MNEKGVDFCQGIQVYSNKTLKNVIQLVISTANNQSLKFLYLLNKLKKKNEKKKNFKQDILVKEPMAKNDCYTD